MRLGARAAARAAALALSCALALAGAGCLTARIPYDEDEAPRAAAREAADRSSGRERFLAYTGDRKIAGELEATLRLYRRRDGAEVLLVPMVHYADASFYEEAARRIGRTDLVLLEGGAPAPGPDMARTPPGGERRGPPMPVDETAEIFGALDLVPQPEGAAVGLQGPRYESGDVDPAELSARIALVQKSAEQSDAQEFPGASYSWDRFWYGAIFRGERWKRVWRHAFATRLEPSSERPIQAVLIDPRNDAVLAKLDAALEEAARREAPGAPAAPARRPLRVAVPWGAEHMPGIERGLFARRFEVVSSERITAWRVRSFED